MQSDDSPANIDKSINKALASYKVSLLRKSVGQLLNTILPFALLWYLMLVSLEYSYWVTLLLSVPAAGLLVRLFILQHDCGHGSFFKSRSGNDKVGSVLGILTLTPYQYWRKTHAIHHATSGDLGRRSVGDVYTLTVNEYLTFPRLKRLAYRLYRNPIIFFGIGPIYQFVLKHRFPLDLPWSQKREWASVMGANLAILLVVVVMWKTVGIQRFLLVQLPITWLAGIAGVWLFYVQHQFEDTYWEPHTGWDYFQAAIRGCSYYDLPRVLAWFTGDIGIHHIHHLCSLIPNYRLKECYDEVPPLRQVTRLTLWGSLKCASLKLWDPEQRKLVGFRHLRSNRLSLASK